MTDGPYTTLTVEAYNRLVITIKFLRSRIQKARELMETGAIVDALEVLKREEE